MRDLGSSCFCVLSGIEFRREVGVKGKLWVLFLEKWDVCMKNI